MIHRGNIQNDKSKSPGYVGRTIARTSVPMFINAHGDKVLYSSDFGSTYTEKATINAPNSMTITNSHPSSIHSGNSLILACNASRISQYESPSAAATRPFSYYTDFEDENGRISKLNLDSTNYYTGNGGFVSADGTRKIVFCRARFKDWDSIRNTFLSYYNGTWYRSTKWESLSAYDAGVSDDLRIIVNIAEKSLDYGNTVTTLNPGSGYTIVRVALSGTGDVLYAIRERKRDSQFIIEAWLSVSYDYGVNWINIKDLLPFNSDRKYTTRRGSSVVTNKNGDCVAFIYNDKYLGWSPNRGEFWYTKTLNYTLPFNQLSMDRSGYYLCITNTNIVMPTRYIQNSELTAVYTMNMHTLQSGNPEINTGISTCAATAILR